MFRGLTPSDANIPVMETHANIVALVVIKLMVPVLTAFTLKVRHAFGT